jgi:hypothetical protein
MEEKSLENYNLINTFNTNNIYEKAF